VWKRLGLDKQNDDTLLKLWTIGVNPAVASDKTCTGQAGGCAGEEEAEADEGVWFPVELDVPGNQSGKMPYQALINFNKNTGGERAYHLPNRSLACAIHLGGGGACSVFGNEPSQRGGSASL
jgi:hypothetical protein